MKYVALLSGGKDSCYNLVHCSRNGHDLVAAASLGPETGKEELDSYLYQTVGQDAIEFVAKALEVPLYRQVIKGTAIEQSSEYGGRNAKDAGGIPGDETEDLYTLLSRVKEYHPDIQGVAVGAILSNYQRVRVEHVCNRLGLAVLCYLWQRNQSDLLAEMIESGMEAILIKVAGAGLTQFHLGKTLSQMQATLLKLNTVYGSHVCGEGGEYETLTLNCPLFRHRIVIENQEIVIHSDKDFASVAFLRIKAARLEPKSTSTASITAAPPLLADEYDVVRVAVSRSQQSDLTLTPAQTRQIFRHPDVPLCRSRKNGAWVSVSNVYSSSGASSTLEEEVTQCFLLLIDRLAEHSLHLSNCAIINISISSIDIFVRVNTIYATFFGASPPARACISVDLPEGIRVCLDCIAFTEYDPGARQALHVQGLSYWAPANIGPYSQAITAGERIFVSGQIGLIPSQLAVPFPRSLALETALSCQHVSRITSALRENSGGGWVGYTQLNIYWLADPGAFPHVKKGHSALQTLPCPTIFLQVKELPKNALVEKQVILHTGRAKCKDEYGGDVLRDLVPSFHQDEIKFGNGDALRWEVSNLEDGDSSCVLVFLRGDPCRNASGYGTMRSALSSYLASALSLRYFYLPSGAKLLDNFSTFIFEGDVPPISPIPCRKISSLQDDDTWDCAFYIVSNNA